MFFNVRSNDSFNFPLGLIKYIVTVSKILGDVCSCLNRSENNFEILWFLVSLVMQNTLTPKDLTFSE